MKKILLLFVLSVMNYFVNGQCFPNSLTITSQDQIDDFATDHPDCTEIGELRIENANNLKGLNQLTSIDLLLISSKVLQNLEGLENVESIQLLEIRFSGIVSTKGLENLKTVQDIYIEYNRELKEIVGFDNLEIGQFINILNNSNLESISTFPRLDDLDGFFVINNVKLKTLKFSGQANNIGPFEIVHCPELLRVEADFVRVINELRIEDNFSLEVLNMKSLSDFFSFNLIDNPNLYECEILCNVDLNEHMFFSTNNGPICTDLQSEKCTKVLPVKVFYDENNNGVFDDSEIPMSNMSIHVLPSNIDVLPYANGSLYIPFFDTDLEKTITLKDYATFNLTTGKDSYTIKKDDLMDNISYDFGLIHDGDYHDIISNISSFAPRCNEEVEFKLKLTNIGSYIENGKVVIRYDGYNEFTGKATPTPDAIDTEKHLLYYNYENFKPFEIKEYLFTLKMPGVEAIDKFISNSGVIYNVVDGDTSLISHCNLREKIQCSFDPNDKTAYPPGVQDENYTLKSDTLQYRIRFQNTGNAEAYDITVRDTISEYLDMSTLNILASSHSVQTSISRGTSREIAFTFKDIHLPDSTSNPEGSQGYVMYEILPKKNLPENTVIENTAFIYFDYNPAIVTNTAFNTMVTTIPTDIDRVEEPEFGLKFSIYPSLTNDRFRIDLETEMKMKIVVLNTNGQNEMTFDYQKGDEYSLGKLNSGMYFISIVDAVTNAVLGVEKIMVMH